MSNKYSKTRELSEKELNEIFDTSCEKYLNKTVKINNLHALSKYLYWITNYYHERIFKTENGDTTSPEVQILIDQLTNYAKIFINLGYKKYFSDFSIQAYHWSENFGNGRKYQKGDFSGMIMKLQAGADSDNYFELSVVTPYLRDGDYRNQYHKAAQYVKSHRKNNNLTDTNKLDDSTKDLSYLFLPADICVPVEDNILKLIEENDDLKCWIILQTGYSF